MAHPSESTEAVDAPVDDMDSAAAAIGKLNLGDDEPAEDDQQPAGDDQEDEGEDLDLNDEQEDEEDEPQDAAIDVPASLNAEEKAAFAAASPEAQRAWAAAETRRNAQVQQATTKASEAQRTAETAAARADAQAKSNYAQQLKVFAEQLAPQAPDPQLAQHDPAQYIAMKAQYDAAKAQHDDFVQQVQALHQDAGSQLADIEVQERDRYLMALPEVQNEETRNGFFEKATKAATRIGLNPNQLNTASGSEWKALREISDAFDKADKYDAAMARQMQRVRDGKKVKPNRPNAAQPQGERRGFREATERLRQTGSIDDAAAAIGRL